MDESDSSRHERLRKQRAFRERLAAESQLSSGEPGVDEPVIDPGKALELRIRRWMSQETRRDRRSLLAASSAGIVVASTDLVPTEITALGVTFEGSQRSVFLWGIAAVVVYLIAMFLLRVHEDYRVRDELRANVGGVSFWPPVELGNVPEAFLYVGLPITLGLASLAVLVVTAVT